ncbi:MAG: DUF4129 domain-containing protein [Bacteroidetes bacterium]|uniref:DUF4129 domain-containing protein n=1 Tax=Phnomibacter sp. TaxID=2836217 RepID=UPI002FDF024C|nr:DUF4129 domain-containing protein [Bacteroidota bacterium]
MARIISVCIACVLMLLFYNSTAQVAPPTEVDTGMVEEYVAEDTVFTNTYETSEDEPSLSAPADLVFGKEDLRQLRQQPDYEYMAYIDSLLRHQKLEPEDKKVADDGRELSLEWIRPLLWVLSIVGLLFLLYKLWTDHAGIFKPFDKKKAADQKNVPEDPLMVQGAAALAAQAIQQKDYRSAVRYLFIDALARLDEQGLIQRIARKTNQQYLAEIQQPELKELLATMMLQFEYVWYGEFTPSEQQFNRILQTHKQLEARWL